MLINTQNKIIRGEIYNVNLPLENNGDTHIQYGIRPCIVISNNIGNEHSPCLTVAPLTTKKQNKRLPVHVPVLASDTGLEYDSIILIEQSRIIDKSMLLNKVGELNSQDTYSLNRAIAIAFGITLSVVA